MGNLAGLVSVVEGLRAERTHLVDQLKHVDAALAVLGKLNGGIAHSEPRRPLSASARRRISLAQKARWAKSRNVSSISGRQKRTMSVSARRKIAAAQRVRWSKWRAQQKKAA